ncbi:DOMON domain-containing protein [Candidatus Fermentibacteria bacterium]|nr:DOMON domain-containing protein [Candidatus Fermentibacteria bacterium]
MNRYLPTVACVAIAFMSGCGDDPAGPSGEGWQEVTVDGITLAWLAEGDSLQVELTAPTTGWVAAGFDPSVGMQDANILIGYFDADSSSTAIRDDWGNAPASHRSDLLMGGTEDILSFEASESAGTTTLSFAILLDTGDAYDKPLEHGSSYDVILAYGPDGADDFTTQHELATVTTVTLQE